MSAVEVLKWHRIRALCRAIDCKADEVSEERDETTFSVGRAEYLVLTDDEANEKAKDYILDSLWAFRPEFLIGHTNLPAEAEEMLRSWQEERCEGANDTIRALLTDKDDFVDEAISADGRGHFIATYDGEETESGRFYVYRIN